LWRTDRLVHGLPTTTAHQDSLHEINTRDNERVSFDYAVRQAKEHGNAAALKELEAIAPFI
jgi:hypothetical protein